MAGRGKKTSHLLIILPTGKDWQDAPDHAVAQAALKRRGKKTDEIGKAPLAVELPGGCLSAWVALDAAKPAFDWHEQLRKAMKSLLDENPAGIEIAVYGDLAFRERAARAAVHVAWLNGTALTNWKSEKPEAGLRHIVVHGAGAADFDREQALAQGNLLTRELTRLPPNLLTPASYRKRIRALAKAEGWRIEEYDTAKLTKLKAGAFLAVARGSGHQDAAIVRLSYAPPTPALPRKRGRGQTVAIIGKGICFDTGGHNLKPARYMHNMHDDMNGSAVALGILLAATRLQLPVQLEVWLAIAQNHLSPEAYTQNEVVTALNGTTIEVVHTDAEGRMVLADTLALAAKEKPAAMIDFATLTGSMAVALGER
ncbi:MAG: leucyl aminopeptidase family protein, partial [Thiobacillus sp.]|nr:leucyl aminopeptidase family protein [Thiobacillus sp.]